MQRSRQTAGRSRRWSATVAAIVSVAVMAPWATGAAGAAVGAQRGRGASAGALATLQVQAKGVDVNPAGKGGWATAKDGQSLRAGDAVRTDATGSAEIAYADGSLTRLDVDTEYKLVKLSDTKGDRKTKGLQTAGQTWHRVEKLADDDSYKVEGANATAAVLGTAFVVTCVSRNQCTFTAVVDPIRLTDPGPRNGTKTITLTPGDQATVSDDAIGPVTTLTQEELLAIQWIVENLLADQSAGKSTGTSEIASQPDPPPARVPSSPVQDPPPPPPPPAGGGTGTAEVPANQGPSATDDAYAMPEDTLLAIAAPGVLGNDSDPEGTPLELFLTGLPRHGSLTTFADGGFVYFPDANFNGVDSWTYVAGDGEFGSSPATVTITVTPQADAPIAANDAYSVAEDQTLTVPAPGVLGNDSDPDGTPLTVVGDFETADHPDHGTLELHGDGSFTYHPDENFHGADTFTYQASDGALLSNIATVTITVSPVNDAPVATAESYTAVENTALVIAAPGVLENDTDPDNDPLTVIWPPAVGITVPEHGTLTPGSNGAFTYTPDDDYVGPDSFTYRVTDGSLEAAATVLITVQAMPVAVDDSFTFTQTADEVAIPAPGFLGNDTIPEATGPEVVVVQGFQHGSGALNPDGVLFWQADDPDFTGTDTAQYKLKNGDAVSNVATITLHVLATAPPSAPSSLFASCGIAYLCSPIGGTTTVPLQGTDPNIPALDLTYRILSLPADATLEQDATTLEVGSELTSPSITFADSGEGAPGYRSFTYEVENAAGLTSAPPTTVYVWVGPAPDPRIHQLDSGQTEYFTLVYTGGTSATITSLPADGVLSVQLSGEGGSYWYALDDYDIGEGGYDIALGQLLRYQTGESDGVSSFDWTANDAGGSADPVTEYFVVGGAPVVEDAFGSTTGTQPVTLRFQVNAEGIGTADITCWGYGSPTPAGGTIDFGPAGADYFELVFTPPAEFSGVVHFYASACIDGAFFNNGATGYVAVDFTPAAPDASAADVPTSLLQGEDAYFTIVVNGASSSQLPTLITLTNTPSPPGTLEFLGSEGDSFFYVWHPHSEAASTTTLELSVSNGFTATALTVELPYSPNVGL